MPRRIELADVADGITGHVLWAVGATGFPSEVALGSTYQFDLVAGTATPASRRLERLALEYRADFARHLRARSIGDEWVRSASLTVAFGERTVREVLMTCRVEITDDRGRTHTSTRRGGVWQRVRCSFRSLVLSALTRRRPV